MHPQCPSPLQADAGAAASELKTHALAGPPPSTSVSAAAAAAAVVISGLSMRFAGGVTTLRGLHAAAATDLELTQPSPMQRFDADAAPHVPDAAAAARWPGAVLSKFGTYVGGVHEFDTGADEGTSCLFCSPDHMIRIHAMERARPRSSSPLREPTFFTCRARLHRRSVWDLSWRGVADGSAATAPAGGVAASNRWEWQRSIGIYLAPLEFKKPQQAGRLTRSCARRGWSG
eukprot:43330-Chlamydomonas_euryale.AAC.2